MASIRLDRSDESTVLVCHRFGWRSLVVGRVGSAAKDSAEFGAERPQLGEWVERKW